MQGDVGESFDLKHARLEVRKCLETLLVQNVPGISKKFDSLTSANDTFCNFIGYLNSQKVLFDHTGRYDIFIDW